MTVSTAYAFEPKRKNIPKVPEKEHKGFLDTSEEQGIYVSSWTIYLDKPTWEILGKPVSAAVDVDENKKAIRLTPAPDEYLIRLEPMTRRKKKPFDGEMRYRLLNFGGGRRGLRRQRILGTLPNGFYKPIGGGIFEFDPYSKRNRAKDLQQ